jgi:hypothetical protein
VTCSDRDENFGESPQSGTLFLVQNQSIHFSFRKILHKNVSITVLIEQLQEIASKTRLTLHLPWFIGYSVALGLKSRLRHIASCADDIDYDCIA